MLTERQFFNLLRRRTRRTAAAVDRRIEAAGRREMAVLMSDASGFSRKTREYGILQFLAVMTQCYDRLVPVLEKRRGQCLAKGADNILAIFEDPADAVAAAVDMQLWLRRRNRGRRDADRFNICIGVHFGPLVRLSDNAYGETVNTAAKIGEDLAAKDEVLVTGEVAERVRDRFRCVYSRATMLGGRSVELYRVRY